MQLSERQASSFLSLLASRTQARRVLECGLAGPAEITARKHLYDPARVTELAERPALTTTDLREWGLTGLNVIRVPPAVPASVVKDPAALKDWATGPWRPGWPVGLLLKALVTRPIPTVVLIGPFFAGTWDAVDATLAADGVKFEFTDPGAWASATQARHWLLGRGGRTFRYLDLSRPQDHWFG